MEKALRKIGVSGAALKMILDHPHEIENLEDRGILKFSSPERKAQVVAILDSYADMAIANFVADVEKAIPFGTPAHDERFPYKRGF